ncbi:hypothetical protein EYR36_008149 [Pleurotus pulmonarius]|nr:hypothetical protein EYR36_008149 [Pleurotus pulmonarius]
MAPPSKSSPEQLEYLRGLLDQFLEAQKHGRLDRFWPELFRGWFSQWHEEEDTSIVDEGERKSDLGVRLGKRQEYLKRWFQNKTAAKTRAPPKELPIPPEEALKTVRRPQLLQLYTKKYYKTRIRSKIYDELPAGTKLSSGAFLALLQKMTPEIFELEDKEIKKEIEDRYEALKKHVEGPGQEQPPVQTIAARYAAAIEDIPRHFQAFSQELNRRTGWSFTLLAGGPDPINGGRVNSIGVHFGLDNEGQHFGKATPAFGDTVLTPYATFLNTLYTKAECDARSLIPIDSGGSSPADLASAATVRPSGQAVVENPIGHVSAPTLPVPFAAPSAPAALNTNLPLAPDALSLPDFNEFDWSEWATFNGTPTIPYKAPDAPFDRDGIFGSILDELAADLPEYITSTSNMSINVMAPIASASAATASAVPTSPVLTAPVIAPVLPAAVPPITPVLSMPAAPVAAASTSPATAPVLPAAVPPITPVLSMPAAPVAAASTSPATAPVLPAAVPPIAPVLSMPAAPVVADSDAETNTTGPETATVGPTSGGPGDTITAGIGPLTDIEDPAMLPRRPRKRARDATEDPSFIMTGKRIRKPSERKESMTVATGKNKRAKKTTSKRSKEA